MGVPGFFLWLWRNYKKSNFVFTKNDIPDIDNQYINNIDYLLLDMNCMIHPICFSTLKDINNPKSVNIKKLENKMMLNVIEYLEKMINCAQPKKGIYIAIDGVAPVAKMKQQRYRRFKSIYDKDLYNSIRKKHNKEIPYYWSNSSITPGTQFMKQLTDILIGWAKNYSKTNNIQIIFSPSNVPAEGEHKLLQFIRNNDTIYNYVVYGLDADLIFLMLTTGLDTVYLMREANMMDGKIKDGINFVSIQTMKQCIVDSINKIIKKNEYMNIFNPKRLIDDFIFICYLMGNDFLPHIVSLDIYENAIDTLLECYIDTIGIENKYIIDRDDKNYINNDIFYTFLIKLASLEEQTIVEARGKKKHNPYCLSTEPYDMEIHRIENMMFKIKDPIMIGDGNMVEWRERYYNYYYNVQTDELDDFSNKMVYHYMIGLKWITMYYFDKCPSWDWYYPFDHAPFINDMIRTKFKFNTIKFTKDKPVSPFEQLLIVLPKESSYLLPKELQKIMTNPNGSASHLYPTKFELDMIGKKKYWMCIPLLPNLEINLIKKLFEKYSKILPENMRELNSIGQNIIF